MRSALDGVKAVSFTAKAGTTHFEPDEVSAYKYSLMLGNPGV
jgi:hypothetical protein